LFLALEKTFFKLIPLLRQPCPVGGGGAYDASVFPEKLNTFTCREDGIILMGDAEAAGAKAPRASDSVIIGFFIEQFFYQNCRQVITARHTT
jgi:hypothetical protein